MLPCYDFWTRNCEDLQDKGKDFETFFFKANVRKTLFSSWMRPGGTGKRLSPVQVTGWKGRLRPAPLGGSCQNRGLPAGSHLRRWGSLAPSRVPPLPAPPPVPARPRHRRVPGAVRLSGQRDGPRLTLPGGNQRSAFEARPREGKPLLGPPRRSAAAQTRTTRPSMLCLGQVGAPRDGGYRRPLVAATCVGKPPTVPKPQPRH